MASISIREGRCAHPSSDDFIPLKETKTFSSESTSQTGLQNQESHTTYSSVPSKNPALYRVKVAISNGWAFEATAIAFSLACLIAMIGVLIAYDGTQLQPLRYGLTLNAIVSTLATASKTSLLAAVAGAMGQLQWHWFHKDQRLYDLHSFDSATRGPAGSISFLCRRTKRSLAALGAIITILALVFDPFVQQILTYPQRSNTFVDDSAIAQKASKFLAGTQDLQLTNAINTGIWTSPSRLRRDPICDSGDCWWPKFESIGWCSECHDIRDQVQFTGDCESPSFDNDDDCQMSVDDRDPITVLSKGKTDTELTAEWQYEIVRSWDNYAKTPYTDAINHTLVTNPLVTVQRISLDISDVLSLKGPVFGGTYPRMPTLSKSDVKAAEQCVLSPCMRKYELATKDGLPVTKVESTNHGQLEFIHLKQSDHTIEEMDTLCWRPDAHDAEYHFSNSWNCDDQAQCTSMADQNGPAFCNVQRMGEAI